MLLLTIITPARAATVTQLHARQHRQLLSLRRFAGTVRFFSHHPRQARSRVGRRELRRARFWVRVIRSELAETRAALVPPFPVPSSWVAGALCVHSGWHYATTGRGRPDYVLGRQRYWRTSDVPDSIAGGSGEGGWDAANGRYGGGLQMDGQFQSNYGSEFLVRYGPAGRWPAAVQLVVAYRGWLRQGWGAWPNTSRACGLR